MDLAFEENNIAVDGSVLMYHVVPSVVYSPELVDGLQMVTEQGQSLRVAVVNGVVLVNGAELIATNILTNNAVVSLPLSPLPPSCPLCPDPHHFQSAGAWQCPSANTCPFKTLVCWRQGGDWRRGRAWRGGCGVLLHPQRSPAVTMLCYTILYFTRKDYYIYYTILYYTSCALYSF